MMRMIVTIGYQDYVCDPQDAIMLLTISNRMIPVKQHEWGKPYRQTGDRTAVPFITKAELVEYEPLALPAEPDPIPEPPPEAMPF